MTFNVILAFTNAVLCTSLVIYVFWVDTRAFAHRTFAVGMSALALMEVFVGMGAQAVLPAEVVGWERLSFAAAAFSNM